MKLHRQLVLLLLAALLPLGVMFAVFGAATLRQGQEAIERDAQGRVSVVAAEIGREIDAQVEVLQTLGQSPLLDIPSERGRFGEEVSRVLSQQPLWRAVTLLDADGLRVMNVPVMPPQAPPRVIDAASHAQVLRTGRPVIGRIMRPPGMDAAFVVFVPVIRHGEVRYVLSAIIQPKAIRERLLAAGLPKGWRIGVLDGSGRLVTRSVEPDLATREATAPVKAALARAPDGFYRTVGLDGLPVVSAYRRLPGSGWSVHLAIPRGMYEAPVRRSVWVLVGGAVVSLLLMAVFLYLLSREMRLRQQQEAGLEEARRMEALGQITGGVAHDFNNLLMIVQGSADLLKRRVAGQGRAEALTDAILVAAQRGQTLTRQLLAFGRRSSHEPVSFRLQDRAEELQGLLQRSVSGEIVLDLRLPPEVWAVHADPSALEVALINLAVNARDAMPQGGRLTVSAANAVLSGKGAPEGLAGDFVVISVNDTGIGIPAEHLARIFEPFYTTKPVGRGTGLGLSQVYGFARQSGGRVIVRSIPGEGATFTLYLPRSLSEPTAPVDRTEAEAAAAEGRILLVEDNAEVAEITQAMLRSAGYTVAWVADAAAGLAALEQDPGVDMVVSDIVLGGMSGLDMAARIRMLSPTLPILLVTGYSEALATGASHSFPVLAKPFGQTELLAAVRRALRTGKTAFPTEAAAAT